MSSNSLYLTFDLDVNPLLIQKLRLKLSSPTIKNIQQNPIGILSVGKTHNLLKALDFSEKYQLPHWHLATGFIAYSPFKDGASKLPYSYILDQEGIYYDASRSSALEQKLKQLRLSNAQLAEAKHLISILKAQQISQNNYYPGALAPLKNHRESVLIIDINVPNLIFQHMLTAARDENPQARILVLTNRYHLLQKIKPATHFSTQLQFYDDKIHPHQLIKLCQTVYTQDSILGFEALLAGRTVRCFGLPFYAGWGLTLDERQCPRRNKQLQIEEIFYGAYIEYVTYLHPLSKQNCTLEDILEHLILQKKIFAQNKGRWLCYPTTPYKQNIIKDYLKGADSIVFRKKLKSHKYDKAICWASNTPDIFKTQVKNLHQMEDGFIRSQGLGIYGAKPHSLVVDEIGIYYDATQPSKLEHLLNTVTFSDLELEQANRLITYCIEHKITKYNLSNVCDLAQSLPTTQKKILVIGQVHHDASLRKGCFEIKNNYQLLVEVKQQYPHAFILYKPHPDIISGGRKDPIAKSDYQSMCDVYVEDRDIISCFEMVDEVHTMTSLSGFEALMRQIPVYTYGLPFYAGWGLTHDVYHSKRRQQNRTLQELVTAVLMLYPRYFNGEVFMNYFEACSQVTLETRPPSPGFSKDKR